MLFNDTVEYNIAYGRPGRQPRAKWRRRRARRASTTSSQPRRKGYETMVGERGLKLSGGEKQRVAIARTLLKNPPIADLRRGHLGARLGQRARDPGRAASSAAQNKTTLVIAHRLSTVVDAHEILVLEAGRDRRARHARGSCWRSSGRYAQMWALQKIEATAARSLNLFQRTIIRDVRQDSPAGAQQPVERPSGPDCRGLRHDLRAHPGRAQRRHRRARREVPRGADHRRDRPHARGTGADADARAGLRAWAPATKACRSTRRARAASPWPTAPAPTTTAWPTTPSAC